MCLHKHFIIVYLFVYLGAALSVIMLYQHWTTPWNPQVHCRAMLLLLKMSEASDHRNARTSLAV